MYPNRRSSAAAGAAVLLAAMLGLAACGGSGDDGGQAAAQKSAPTPAPAAAPEISGRIEDGLRVLTVDPAADGTHLRIHRGDYVRLEAAGGGPLTVAIPALGVDMTFPPAEGDKGYFKVPEAGEFAYTIGDHGGVIEAVDYAAASYREVSAADAAAFIAEQHPFILDVRTPREFAAGHLEGASLVPVQVLQQQLPGLMGHRDEPVLVYCHTGNRSTVAAKLLVDAGFRNVVNMRRGIADWERQKLPVVR